MQLLTSPRHTANIRTMLSFFARRPKLGIDLSASAVRIAEVDGNDGTLLRTATIEVPPGMVREDFGSENLLDPAGFTSLLRERFSSLHYSAAGRPAALSLPDGVFRVQFIEFDQLPPKRADRDRLVQWRLEKSGTVDMARTVLKHQVITRPDKGHTVLACVAKQPVVRQYEQVLIDLGLEPWTVGPSSFHAANWYARSLSAARVTALVHLRPDSVAALVFESGQPVFYRYKEMKKSTGDVRARLVREIDDSLHFYSHMDRSLAQQAEVQTVLLCGDSPLADDLSRELQGAMSVTIEVLLPSAMAPVPAGVSANTIPGSLASALGAGGQL